MKSSDQFNPTHEIEAVLIVNPSNSYQGAMVEDIFTPKARKQMCISTKLKGGFARIFAVTSEPFQINMFVKRPIYGQKITDMDIKDAKRDMELLLDALHENGILVWKGYRALVKILRQKFCVANGEYSDTSFMVEKDAFHANMRMHLRYIEPAERVDKEDPT